MKSRKRKIPWFIISTRDVLNSRLDCFGILRLNISLIIIEFEIFNTILIELGGKIIIAF